MTKKRIGFCQHDNAFMQLDSAKRAQGLADEFCRLRWVRQLDCWTEKFNPVLREPWLKLRGLYRVLLIVPWAVPNYITALIWKGMFHSQFGAVNALLDTLGIEPVPWFSSFWTAFAANVTTNTWLGFPFMMVVCLGALQAIPRELEEAAEMDGAGGWTREGAGQPTRAAARWSGPDPRATVQRDRPAWGFAFRISTPWARVLSIASWRSTSKTGACHLIPTAHLRGSPPPPSPPRACYPLPRSLPRLCPGPKMAASS